MTGEILMYRFVSGAGGGYNERENVEYNDHREESDGEYDEVSFRIEISLNS